MNRATWNCNPIEAVHGKAEMKTNNKGAGCHASDEKDVGDGKNLGSSHWSRNGRFGGGRRTDAGRTEGHGL